jgi:hypothetical protein
VAGGFKLAAGCWLFLIISSSLKTASKMIKLKEMLRCHELYQPRIGF